MCKCFIQEHDGRRTCKINELGCKERKEYGEKSVEEEK